MIWTYFLLASIAYTHTHLHDEKWNQNASSPALTETFKISLDGNLTWNSAAWKQQKPY